MYQINFSSLIRNLIYLIAIVPLNDITVADRWSTTSESLIFYYATNDETSKTVLYLNNSADYSVDYFIEQTDAYIVNPGSGVIESGGSVKIDISAYMTLANLPALVINSVGIDTASCFEYLALDVKKVVAGINTY